MRSEADVIADIYEAATDPDGLGRVPEIFRCVADGGSGVVAVIRSDGWVDAVTCNQPREGAELYASYYRHVNPLDRLAAMRGPMVTTRSNDLMPEVDYRRSEFYTDFARVFDTHHILGTSLIPVRPGLVGHIGVHRSGPRTFRTRDIGAVQRLLPHLQRALQMRARLNLLQGSALGFAGLEALAVACVVCNADGLVVFANSAASLLVTEGCGLVLGSQHISALVPSDAKRLASLIVDAATGGSGGPIAISGPNGNRAFALVAPLPARFGALPGHALVALRSANSAPSVTDAALGDLFGLTPAEAQLALALLAGRSLAEVVAWRGVTENTLRTQLASVLRKTGASSQRDLVRLLSLLPPLARDDGRT